MCRNIRLCLDQVSQQNELRSYGLCGVTVIAAIQASHQMAVRYQISSPGINGEIIQKAEVVFARDVQQEVVGGMWFRLRYRLHAGLYLRRVELNEVSGAGWCNEVLRRCASQYDLRQKITFYRRLYY